MNELEQSRKEINDIDEQMAHLFERRMNVCARIAGYKKEHGLSVRDPAREEDLINKNKSLIEDAELEPYYVRFLRNNIDVSCEYQSKAIEGIKVSYCGTEGAFSQLAAKRMFPEAELAAFREFAAHIMRSRAENVTVRYFRLKTVMRVKSARLWIWYFRATFI